MEQSFEPNSARLAMWMLAAYLLVYAAAVAATLSYSPPYAWPHGDEATYVSQALHPWSLRSELFAGYPPKELISPFNLRGFLTPISLVLNVGGFSVEGPRLVVLSYGLLLLLALFLTARRVAGPWIALAVTVLFSLTPAFAYFSRVVRPEGLFAAMLLGVVGLAIRAGAVAWRRDFLLGALAAGMIWIHYNGAIGLPLAVLLVMGQERSPHLWTRLRWLGWGAWAFAGVYVALNILPGWEFITRFGLWPVTFVSRSDLPLASGRLAVHAVQVVELYKGLLTGTWEFEPRTGWLTLTLAVFGVLGTLWKPRRSVISVVVALVALVALELTVLPNAKAEYLFYVYPLVFLLAAAAWGELPHRARVAVAVACVAAAVLYGGASLEMLGRWRVLRQQNAAAETTIAQITARCGPPASTTVLGPQEFFAATYPARYRTVHALAVMENVGQLLELHNPDVVILTPRLITLSDGLLHRDIRGPRAVASAALLRQRFINELTARGYRPETGPLSYNETPLEVFTRCP